MRTIVLLVCVLILGSSIQGQTPDSGSTRAYEFINGNWFNGQGFVSSTFFTVQGKISFQRPVHVDSVIDLTDKYVVPPYAEAHNHNIDGSRSVAQRIKRYLADGIFYVKNPNSIPARTSYLAGTVNTPNSIDVTFSNGGLTSSGGHPIDLVRRNIRLGIFTEKDAEGGMYYVIDNERDLDNNWEAITRGRPDFVKTYLLYSEEFSERRTGSSYFGWRGLDPALLPKIVERAHAHNLRVSTHVETATDFHHAVVAGVDEINHLPGFRADSAADFSCYEIAERDARDAASAGVVVVTTLAGGSGIGSAAHQERLRLLHVRNLRVLASCGVSLAIGSDDYQQTSLQEAFYLRNLGVFDNKVLLKMWCESSAAAIFPDRKIGHLRDGYEASFLVLDGDPILDFSNTQDIVLRVKQGKIISSEK